ncbi:hypothetical protein BJ878DRAFT_336445 [Calycina marina]|uniref:Uncharacterized protein n=1 Tax=Calycina marina TaxID=1763456 RepID=A0A9P7YUB9_9HELO|nr:hypothetical protein BJ878DRAFT_336445 [Calycina marina]
MPFNELYRRDSWPPTILRIREEDEEVKDPDTTIDENPFSFFLTTPEDMDIIPDEDLSAGIESGVGKSPQVREVSPSDIQRSPLLLSSDSDEDEDDVEYGVGIPMSLKDFTRKHTSNGRTSQAGKRGAEGPTILVISTAAFTTRGRAAVKRTPPFTGRGRGRTRSLSARRPRSWRAPSPDLGSITEERESDEDAKSNFMAVKGSSASAPATSYMTHAAPPKPKAKKRVHWVF